MTLFSLFLNDIPLKSLHVPICRYAYYMLKPFGAITSLIVQAEIHTVMFVQLRNNQEADGSFLLTGNSPIVQLMTRFIDILDESCRFDMKSFVISSLAFFIAAFRFYLENCAETWPEMHPLDELAVIAHFNSFTEAGKPLLIRGPVVSDVSQITDFQFSLSTLQYSREIRELMAMNVYSPRDRLSHYTDMRHTSFKSIMCSLLVRTLLMRVDLTSGMTQRELKILSRVLMDMLFS